MSRFKLITTTFLLISAIGILGQQAGGNPPPATNQAQKPNGEEPLQKLLLEDFEQSEDWVARATCPLGETKTLKIVQRGLIKDVFDENLVPDNGGDKVDQNHVLGIKSYFTDRGFDRVEVKPPHEYVVKGKVRQVSVWALGRKFRHTLFVKMRDYKGNTHNIRMGRLDYFGWRKLTAPIPGFLPQSTRFALLDKNLHFVSIFVTSDSHEVPGTFYFYVDDLEVRSDKGDARYPGSEIKDNW